MSTPAPENPTRQDRTLFSNPMWMWLAATFLVLVLIAGGIAVWSGRDSAERATPPVPAPTSAAPVPDQGAGFGTPITDRWGNRVEVPVNQFGQVLTQDPSQQLKPGDPGWTTQPARGIKWQLVYNIPIPFSTSDGPSKVADKVASGYARTPQGAVLSAIDAMSRCSAMGDFVAVACWERRMVNGPGYDSMKSRVERLGTAPRQLTPGASIMPLSWAKVLNYADDYMAVKLAQIDPSNNSAWVVYQVEMVWADNDWRMKSTANSQSAQRGVQSVDGFTRW